MKAFKIFFGMIFMLGLVIPGMASTPISVNSLFGPLSLTAAVNINWTVSSGSGAAGTGANIDLYALLTSSQQGGPPTITGMSWNNVAMKALTTTGQGTNPSSRAYLYELTNCASATSANFSLTNTTASNWTAWILALAGVDPFNPHGANNTINGTAAGAHGLTITTQFANSLLLDMLASTGSSGTQTFTFSTSWTSSAQVQPGSSQAKGGYAYVIQSGTNTFTFSQSVTGGSVTDWSDLVQEIVPVQPTATSTFTASPTPTSTQTPTFTITNTFTVSPTPTMTPTLGIVGYWQGNSTPGRLVDSSGAGNDLTIPSGDPGWPTTPTPVEGDHWLMGVTTTPSAFGGQYNIPNCAVTTYSGAFTVEFYAMVAATAQTGMEGFYFQNPDCSGTTQMTLSPNSGHGQAEFLVEEVVGGTAYIYADLFYAYNSVHLYRVDFPASGANYVKIWVDGILTVVSQRAPVCYLSDDCNNNSAIFNTVGKGGVFLDAAMLATGNSFVYPGPAPTSTPRATPTPTWTVSPTSTPTSTSTRTPTFTITKTFTVSPTRSMTPTISPTFTATPVNEVLIQNLVKHLKPKGTPCSHCGLQE